jgi:hypothetical protein
LELVVQGIGFDLSAGQSRMIVILLLPRDEVPDNPASSVFVVVKVNQSFIRDHPGHAQNDTVVAAAPVIIVVRVYGHISKQVLQAAARCANADLSK